MTLCVTFISNSRNSIVSVSSSISSETTEASDIGLDVDVEVEVEVVVVLVGGTDDDVEVDVDVEVEEEEEEEAVVGTTLSTSILVLSSEEPDTKTLDFESLLLSFVHNIRDCELRI
jgi:hypothetical protein